MGVASKGFWVRRKQYFRRINLGVKDGWGRGENPRGETIQGATERTQVCGNGACECRMAVTVPRALPKYHLKRMYKFRPEDSELQKQKNKPCPKAQGRCGRSDTVHTVGRDSENLRREKTTETLPFGDGPLTRLRCQTPCSKIKSLKEENTFNEKEEIWDLSWGIWNFF